MNTSHIDPSPLHPVMQQALAPFVLLRYTYNGQTYICQRTMQEDIDRDRAALQEQINRPQTVEGFFI